MALHASKACGLDFGTSNSTLGTFVGGKAALVPLEGENAPIPSAVFFGIDADAHFLIGRAAVSAYVDGEPGRLMRSLKAILGSSLVDERTQVFRRRIAFSEIIQMFVAALKVRAEKHLQHGLDSVVMGRPVHFVDNDAEADKYAQETLRQIAMDAGFRHVSFQFEPIAAAQDFERQIDREHLALIADIGGGTSDFTIARLSPLLRQRTERASDILATGGIRLGGTDYDRLLSMGAFMPVLGYGSLQKRGDIDVPSGAYWDLSTWANIHHLYDPKRLGELRAIRHSAMQPQLLNRLIHVVEQRRCHSMLIDVEATKIALSDRQEVQSSLDWIEQGLAVTATRTGFEKVTQRLFDRLQEAAALCVRDAGLGAGQITTVFFTGGTSSIPSVRAAILQGFPQAQVVDGDRFGSVGLGLAVEANLRYGEG